MTDVVFSRCPVGSATEYALRTGALQRALAAEGLRFRLLQELEPGVQAAHFTQEPPLDFREGGNIPPIWAQSLADRTVLLGVSFLWERVGIFVRRDSEISCVSELAGRRLAIPVRADMPVDFQKYTALRGFEAALSAVGLRLADTEPVEIPCAKRHVARGAELTAMKREFEYMTGEIKAVECGEADAAFANSVKALRHMDAGKFRNLLPQSGQPSKALNNNNPLLVTCSRKLAQTRPEIAVLYLRELLRAAREAAGRPQAYINAVCDGVYEASPSELARTYAPETAAMREPALGNCELGAVQEQIEFLYRAGAIGRMPSVTAWAEPGFLEKARVWS